MRSELGIKEVKGLENKYIIGVNLLSSFKKKWEEMIRYDGEVKGVYLEESYFHRYLLNMLYVTITRAQENLCFIEDEVNADFIADLFQTVFQNETYFDVQVFELEEDSEAEDFYREAQKYEAAEDYQRALLQYEKLRMPKAQLRSSFCRGKLAELKGDFYKAGTEYEKAKEFELATKAYKKAGDYRAYYTNLINWNERLFMEQVLLNSEVDY